MKNIYELVNAKGELIDYRPLTAKKALEDNEKFAQAGLTSRWRRRQTTQSKCECELPGYFNSGFPGILAHIEDGEIASKTERCDACELYEDDKAALLALLKLRQQSPVKK